MRLRTLRRAPRVLLSDAWEGVVTNLPGHSGAALRQRYWRRRLADLGAGAYFEPGVSLVHPELIWIDANCWIDRNSMLLAGRPWHGKRKITRRERNEVPVQEGELRIGSGTHIAPHAVVSGHGGVLIEGDTTIGAGARLYSLTHVPRAMDDPTDRTRYRFSSRAAEDDQALLSAPVYVGLGAAVGTNSVVLPGVSIGRESWVGANSVVTRDVPPGVIVVGSPARIVRRR